MSETPHPRQEPQDGILRLPAEDKVPDNPGRVAIVTGAARGIGAATARRLAADGMAVAVLDLDAGSCDATVEAIASAGGRAIAVGADVSEDDQVEAAVATVAEEFGPPTVLVNNAGVLRDNLLFKMSEDDWDTVLNVHLRGSFLMGGSSTRSTWWISGTAGSSTCPPVLRSATGGQANYSAAKAGMQGLTKTLAIELGQFGITANAVAPGFIATDMTAATAARLGMTFGLPGQLWHPRCQLAGSARSMRSRTPSPSWPARVRDTFPAR